MENSMEVSQQTKNWSIIWSTSPTSVHIARGGEINIPKEYMHAHVSSRNIHNS